MDDATKKRLQQYRDCLKLPDHVAELIERSVLGTELRNLR